MWMHLKDFQITQIKAACGKMAKPMTINHCWWQINQCVSTRQVLGTWKHVRLKVDFILISNMKTSLEMAPMSEIQWRRWVKAATSIRKVSYEKWKRSRTRSTSHLRVSSSLSKVDSTSSLKRILTSPAVQQIYYWISFQISFSLK